MNEDERKAMERAIYAKSLTGSKMLLFAAAEEVWKAAVAYARKEGEEKLQAAYVRESDAASRIASLEQELRDLSRSHSGRVDRLCASEAENARLRERVAELESGLRDAWKLTSETASYGDVMERCSEALGAAAPFAAEPSVSEERTCADRLPSDEEVIDALRERVGVLEEALREANTQRMSAATGMGEQIAARQKVEAEVGHLRERVEELAAHTLAAENQLLRKRAEELEGAIRDLLESRMTATSEQEWFKYAATRDVEALQDAFFGRRRK